MDLEKYLQVSPYALTKDKKQEFLLAELNSLTKKHSLKCTEYNSILTAYDLQNKSANTLN